MKARRELYGTEDRQPGSMKGGIALRGQRREEKGDELGKKEPVLQQGGRHELGDNEPLWYFHTTGQMKTTGLHLCVVSGPVTLKPQHMRKPFQGRGTSGGRGLISSMEMVGPGTSLPQPACSEPSCTPVPTLSLSLVDALRQLRD